MFAYSPEDQVNVWSLFKSQIKMWTWDVLKAIPQFHLHLQDYTIMWEVNQPVFRSAHMCFISGLSGGINTFCNNIRMTGMGSLWQGTGLRLSVWPYMVVFVSGGNPVSEAQREAQSKRVSRGDGCWKRKKKLLTQCLESERSKVSFQYCSYLVRYLRAEQTHWGWSS